MASQRNFVLFGQIFDFCSSNIAFLSESDIPQKETAMVHTVAAACIKKDLKKQLGVCAI